MTFNLLHDSTGTSVTGQDALADYFESTVYPTWLGGLANYTVSSTPGTSGTIAITRVANNSSEELTDYFFVDYTLASDTHVVLADPNGDQLNVDTSGVSTNFGSLLDDISGDDEASAVLKMFQSDVDTRSWFMTLNGRIIAFDLGDNFYRYSPGASDQFAKQYYWVLVPANSSAMDTDLQAFNVSDITSRQIADIDPFHMNGMNVRDNVETTYSTDVVTMGYQTTADFNLVIMGARSDVRQLRAATASPSVFSNNLTPPIYQDGANYWASTSSAGLMFDCGTTEPLL